MLVLFECFKYSTQCLVHLRLSMKINPTREAIKSIQPQPYSKYKILTLPSLTSADYVLYGQSRINVAIMINAYNASFNICNVTCASQVMLYANLLLDSIFITLQYSTIIQYFTLLLTLRSFKNSFKSGSENNRQWKKT